jgi:hypothetical protein
VKGGGSLWRTVLLTFSRQTLAQKENYSRKFNRPLVALDHGGVPKVGVIYSTNKNLCPVLIKRC